MSPPLIFLILFSFTGCSSMIIFSPYNYKPVTSSKVDHWAASTHSCITIMGIRKLRLNKRSKFYNYAPTERNLEIEEKKREMTMDEERAAVLRDLLSGNITAGASSSNQMRSGAAKALNSISLYRSEFKSWELSDSFNSTTLKGLFEIKDSIISFWSKVEKSLQTFQIQLLTKISNDVKLTVMTGEYISRVVTNSADKAAQDTISSPLFSLPAIIQDLSNPNRTDTWDMLKAGVNPLDKPKLLLKFSATSTEQRSRMQRKLKKTTRDSPPAAALSAESLYKTARTLPSKLQYDYERRKVRREVAKMGDGGDNPPPKMLKRPSAGATAVVLNSLSLPSTSSVLTAEPSLSSVAVVAMIEKSEIASPNAISIGEDMKSDLSPDESDILSNVVNDESTPSSLNSAVAAAPTILAPPEMVAEFLKLVSQGQLAEALPLCEEILRMDPGNQMMIEYQTTLKAYLAARGFINQNPVSLPDTSNVNMMMQSAERPEHSVILTAISDDDHERVSTESVADAAPVIAVGKTAYPAQTVDGTISNITPEMVQGIESSKASISAKGKVTVALTAEGEENRFVSSDDLSSVTELNDPFLSSLTSDTSLVSNPKTVDKVVFSTEEAVIDIPVMVYDAEIVIGPVTPRKSLYDVQFDSEGGYDLEEIADYDMSAEYSGERGTKVIEIDGEGKIDDADTAEVGSRVVIDTTASVIEQKPGEAEQAVEFLLTAIDVVFFLLESLGRAAGPVLMDGGALAAQRIKAAFTVVNTERLSMEVSTLMPPTGSDVQSWKMLGKLRQAKRML